MICILANLEILRVPQNLKICNFVKMQIAGGFSGAPKRAQFWRRALFFLSENDQQWDLRKETEFLLKNMALWSGIWMSPKIPGNRLICPRLRLGSCPAVPGLEISEKLRITELQTRAFLSIFRVLRDPQNRWWKCWIFLTQILQNAPLLTPHWLIKDPLKRVCACFGVPKIPRMTRFAFWRNWRLPAFPKIPKSGI